MIPPDQSPDESDRLNYEDFLQRMRTVSLKGKEKYKYLLNSGQAFKDCLFDVFETLWRKEKIPDQWRNTTIIQLFKGKGDPSDYSNQRNLHTKNFVPKIFEGMLVDKSKERIISHCSKYQIGAMPLHRSQEHLFTMKSIVLLYSDLEIPLYWQCFDITKHFDKEILKNTMNSL